MNISTEQLFITVVAMVVITIIFTGTLASVANNCAISHIEEPLLE